MNKNGTLLRKSHSYTSITLLQKSKRLTTQATREATTEVKHDSKIHISKSSPALNYNYRKHKRIYDNKLILDQLPEDIFIHITKYLSFQDTVVLQQTSRRLAYKINTISAVIMNRELSKMERPISKKQIYSDLTLLLERFYWDSYESLKSNFFVPKNTWRKTLYNAKFVLLCNLDRCQLSEYKYLDDIIRKILWHFLTIGSICNYPNKLDIVMLYAYFSIYLYKNPINPTYYINFFHMFLQRTNVYELRNLLCEYIKYLLNTQIVLTFDTLSIMSHYVVNPKILKKLFGTKILDLRYTEFVDCCPECYNDNIQNIVNFKYNCPNDSILRQNYFAIKSFLKKQRYDVYYTFVMHEYYIINKQIFFINPLNHRRVRLCSYPARNALRTLKLDTNYQHDYYKLQKYINEQQRYLLCKYFS